jgi:hypothetical protein
LLVGQLEYAAQVALKCGRSTEALLIAEAGGNELYEQIKEEYLSMHNDYFVKNIISSVNKGDFTEVIETSACSWKETLAYMIAYEDDEKIKEVAKALGD